MLLGEHEHSLDDKNRLTLPAKLRAAFEDGVVVSRGLDGCLYAYPRTEWQRLADRIAAPDPLGHASLLAVRLHGDGTLIAVDRDPTVAPYFERFRRSTGVKARLLHGEFSATLEQLAGNDVHADVILLDLGVSSMQLDRPERGFSYAVDAPLDMRMDPSATFSARELVNEGEERDLADIFKRYGEERYARQIA